MELVCRKARIGTLASLGFLLGAGAAQAGTVYGSDGWQVSLDTDVDAGVEFRASPVDYRFVGVANGGQSRTPNADNGTLNFRNNPVTSAPLKITEELDIKYGDAGAFIRGTAFYDPVYNGVTPDFMPYRHATVRDLGFDARLLDAYVYDDFNLSGHRLDFRLGNQAINWGESIFIQGGINSATPFDVNALERPGSELREAVLPFPALDVRANLTTDLSLEAFYEFYWVRTRFPPNGSFFSDNDLISDGGYYAVQDPSFPNSPHSINEFNLATNDPFGPVLLRTIDRHPPNQGEFGIALRYTVPSLGDTEFGLYFENYHSRTPFVDYLTGTLNSAVSNEHLLLGQPGVTYNSTVRYRADYPADIRLIGASFSASLPAGVGLQGEISARLNQPLLLATTDSVLEAEAPFLCHLGDYLASIGLGALGAPAVSACHQARVSPVTAASGGFPGFSDHFPQYKRDPVIQAQVSATKMLPPAPSLGIASLTAISEVGLDFLPNFEREAAVYNSLWATAYNSGLSPAATVNGVLQKKGKVTQAAGGGVFVLVADMPEVLPWGIDMQPSIAVFMGLGGRDATGEGYFQQGQDWSASAPPSPICSASG